MQKRPAHLRIIFRHLVELIIINNHISSVEAQIVCNEERDSELEEEIEQSEEVGRAAGADIRLRAQDYIRHYENRQAPLESELGILGIESDRLSQICTDQRRKILACQAEYTQQHSSTQLLVDSMLDDAAAAQEFSFMEPKLEKVRVGAIEESRSKLQAIQEQLVELRRIGQSDENAYSEVLMKRNKLLQESSRLSRKLDSKLYALNREEFAEEQTRDAEEELLEAELDECCRKLSVLENALITLCDKREHCRCICIHI